ncbi:putative lipase domain protein [Trypanosoma theileri]|uniref:Putative lipase domain protein n=1 Tax=Trypanosoma theileri TaxID=67003 RepID=A0A1X0P0E7_9TRYP|nr:putative lipase domain protein [Trypanosoma theileri]ORC90193.1 putative lipase domain protein [Trypanosoma theileri]
MSNAHDYAQELKPQIQSRRTQSSVTFTSVGMPESNGRDAETRSEALFSLPPPPPPPPPVITANDEWNPSSTTNHKRTRNHKKRKEEEEEHKRKHFTIPRAPPRNLRLRGDATQSIGNVNENRIGGSGIAGSGIDQTLLKEPPELQIEVISPFVAKFILYMWYALLIAAVVVECIGSLSWGLANICGEDIHDLRNYDQWTSPCISEKVLNDTTGLYSIVWEGGPYGRDFDDRLVRFPNLVISFASPDNWGETIENLQVFNLEAHIPGSLNFDRVTALPLTITCGRSSERCDNAELPPTVVLNTTDIQKMSLKLLNIPATLEHGVNNSSIGILYEKRPYGLGSLVWRYVFLFLSFLHLVRFIVYLKFTNTLYEQTWVIVLQLALFWYLNPLSVVKVLSTRPSLVLEFLEYRFPTWFMAVTVGFMFAAITASMSWIPSSAEEREAAKNLRSFKGIKAFLLLSRSIFDPPIWTKMISIMFILIIVALDIADMAWRNEVFMPRAGARSSAILFSIISILFFGAVVCCMLLFHLNSNLGQKSYLDSRPQQLACRVFIIVFVAAILFYVFQITMFFTRYATIPGMAATQPLMQLPAVMVATFLVNIMTLVYTTHNRSSLVPVNPRDQRWKYMVWPNTWYRWLSRHGGSMYIFHTEEEELTFNWNQYAFRMRQYMAKNKRKVPGRARHVRSASQEVTSSPPFQTRGAIPNTDTNAERNNNSFNLTARQNASFITSGQYEDTAVLNMDRTCTFFLPEQTRRNGVSSARPSPRNFSFSLDCGTEDNTSALFCHPSDLQHSLVVNSQEPAANTQVVVPSHFSDYMRLQDSIRRQPIDAGESPQSAPNNVESPMGHTTRDSDGERMAILMRALGLARKKLNSLMRTAERTFISGPVHAFEHMETAFLDTALRPFLDREYLPFFNLETAIDCFNLSWEAYGASQMMMRRMRRMEPMNIFGLCCGCCSPSSSSSSSSSETEFDTMPPPPTDDSGNHVNTNIPQPINVERYGYRLRLVMEALDVQVVISSWDGSNKEGEHKAPRIVIAFRGTANVRNARQDLRLRREVWDEMPKEDTKTFRPLWGRGKPTVHVGFLSIWKAHRQSIHDAVWEFLSSNPSTVYRIYCTGHSLGGALASLCAYSLRKMLVEKKYPLPEVTVYTFGQPPLGNKAFQVAYNKAIPRTFRVVNESDAVALIEFYGSHIGVEVDIDRNGNYICKPTYMERLFRPVKGKGSAVENHLMGNYSASLNAIARGTKCPTTAYEENTSEL